jgi:hypothetical protein
VGDREDVAPFDLRVTTTFRREDDTWKIVHRHADPVPKPHPDGPLRGLLGPGLGQGDAGNERHAVVLREHCANQQSEHPITSPPIGI